MTNPTFGVLHDFRQVMPWQMPPADYYEECVDLICEAEALGYTAAWLCEHHGTADAFLPSPLVMAAALVSRTERIQIGTNVLLLPLHHPLRVAEDAAVVHTLSRGRLILGVGQGYAPHEFELFGVDRAHRPSRFEEGLTIIRNALRDGHTGFSGRRFAIPEGPFEPRGSVPIYVGATTPVSVARAVRLGDGLIIYVSDLEHVSTRWDMLRQEIVRQGRKSFPFAVSTVCHVAPSAEQAWAEAGPAIATLESSFSSLGGSALSVDDLERESFLVGTSEQVAAKLHDLFTAIPIDHLAFWGRLPGLSASQARESMRLFAAEVMPLFQDVSVLEG